MGVEEPLLMFADVNATDGFGSVDVELSPGGAHSFFSSPGCRFNTLKLSGKFADENIVSSFLDFGFCKIFTFFVSVTCFFFASVADSVVFVVVVPFSEFDLNPSGSSEKSIESSSPPQSPRGIRKLAKAPETSR